MGKAKPKPSKNRSAPAEPPKACYVLSLEIENVRCFGPKQTLDLSDGHGRPAQWTIILGENGVGKTTLLQTIVCVERTELFVPPGAMDQPRLFGPSNGQADLMPRHPFDVFGFQRGARSASQTNCSVVLVNGGAFTDDRTDWMEHRFFWRFNDDQSSLDHRGSLLVAPRFYGYGAGRRLNAMGLETVTDDPAGTLFAVHGSLRNAEDWLLQLDYTASKQWDTSATAAKHRDLAKDLLIGVLHDVTDIQFIPGEGMYPRARVEFETPFGWVPLRRLGYGFQTVIAWVTDLVSRMAERYPDSPDPLKEPAIVVVDEIDLHLHPQWQRKLIGFLTERFPNTQFIATAHSPLVVQAAANANLAVLKRVGDHVEIHNDVDQIRGWRIEQILTSELFGLTSADPPEVEKLFERKRELLAKPKLTAAEKNELKQIQVKIDALPVGDTAKYVKEMDAIRKAIDLLQKKSP